MSSSNDAPKNTVFDVPAYFIFTREVLEMAVIIAVLVTFINRIVADNEPVRKKMLRQVWIGSVAGLAVSIGLAVLFIILFQAAKVDIWGTEEFELIFEAVFKLLACLLITGMAFTMLKVDVMQIKWTRKLRAAAQEALDAVDENKWGLMLLPFTVILREGLETLVLLGGTSSSSSATAIILPAIAGTITGCAIGLLVYKGGQRMVLKYFTWTSMIFLLFIGAGLFMGGLHEVEELLGETAKVFSIKDKTFSQKTGNIFFQIMGALFGWRSSGTILTTVAYFAYWLMVIPGLMWYSKKQARAANELKRQVAEEDSAGTLTAGDDSDDAKQRLVA
ncbi:high-affinity iron permease [Blastocladiella emersonii ATCC 22665]|nr:high-affinity iron permease [Blastocladiella emersonii ATCC 22665]